MEGAAWLTPSTTMRDIETILVDLAAAADAHESALLHALALELSTNASLCAELPDAAIDRIRGLLARPDYLALEDSWKLCYFLDDAWPLLTGPQREALRGPLVAAFDEHGDFMGAFVIAELLGRRYSDEPALAALVELSRTAQTSARALVPHGLETLIVGCGREDLRARALARLRELTHDADAQVRQEAELSLRKVERATGARGS
ncbi:MAG: hypothetical protein QM704_03830 [Anaeromyxobacteraceae bacterium]